jgi:hypothetical protein
MRSRDLQKGLDGSQLVVVNKGDALWRIAYRSFGEGVRYIDIVRKNTSDINNPDLIYPKPDFFSAQKWRGKYGRKLAIAVHDAVYRSQCIMPMIYDIKYCQ